MKLELTRGVFLRRYQRFFADVELASGEVVTAHCPNTGSMKTLLNPGVGAWLRWHDNPRRKLPWTLTLLGLPGRGRVLVDTSLPNRIVEEGIRRGRVRELAGYENLRREVPYGKRSRIDLLLEDGRGRANGRPRTCHVEIKSNTMASSVESRRSDFPDSPTERGLRHLEELTALARRGQRVVQFYLVGRTDCGRAGFAEEIHPAYAVAAGRAEEAGVEFLAYRAEIRQDRITVGRRCELEPPLLGKGWR